MFNSSFREYPRDLQIALLASIILPLISSNKIPDGDNSNSVLYFSSLFKICFSTVFLSFFSSERSNLSFFTSDLDLSKDDLSFSTFV